MPCAPIARSDALTPQRCANFSSVSASVGHRPCQRRPADPGQRADQVAAVFDDASGVNENCVTTRHRALAAAPVCQAPCRRRRARALLRDARVTLRINRQRQLRARRMSANAPSRSSAGAIGIRGPTALGIVAADQTAPCARQPVRHRLLQDRLTTAVSREGMRRAARCGTGVKPGVVHRHQRRQRGIERAARQVVDVDRRARRQQRSNGGGIRRRGPGSFRASRPTPAQRRRRPRASDPKTAVIASCRGLLACTTLTYDSS